MNQIDFIADLLTEDPDVFIEGHSRVVIAVHPNHVIDAIVQAASKWADDSRYRDLRAQMMVNYNAVFQEFMNSRKNSTIIITRLSRHPHSLSQWFDPENDEVSDPTSIDQEKIVAFDAYRDLEDFLAELRTWDNVYFFEEQATGDSCKSPKLMNLLQNAELIEMVGGHLTGCLAGMLERVEQLTDVPIRTIEAVTYDDEPKFWSRISQS